MLEKNETPPTDNQEPSLVLQHIAIKHQEEDSEKSSEDYQE